MSLTAGLKRRLLGTKYKLEVLLDNEQVQEYDDVRKHCVVNVNEEMDYISGNVICLLGKDLVTEHLGMKIEWFGQIEIGTDKKTVKPFSYLSQDIGAPGEIRDRSKINFKFQKLDKRYDSYDGKNLKVRYFIKATLYTSSGNVCSEKDLVVRCHSMAPEVSVPIKRELRIEGAMFIGFDCNKYHYHLDDVIVGRIIFRTVRVMIKQIDISITRIEKLGPENPVSEMETLKKYEIMYGHPSVGSVVPVRLYLKYIPLTPSHKNLNINFSVNYYIFITLIDEQDRRYSRKQEIELFRNPYLP